MASSRIPPLTVVAPVYVPRVVIFSVPSPVLIRVPAPLPEIIPEMVAVWPDAMLKVVLLAPLLKKRLAQVRLVVAPAVLMMPPLR